MLTLEFAVIILTYCLVFQLGNQEISFDLTT